MTEQLRAPHRLRCEYLLNPRGIDEPAPRLFWQIADDRRGAVQTAWQVMVASRTDLLEANRPDVWDSGKVDSAANTHVVYAGPELVSRKRYYWKVRTWDATGSPSPWSGLAWWEMGLLERDAWAADWIGREDAGPREVSYLRGTFSVDGAVVQARAYVTALGMFEFVLNGEKVGHDVFAPGWTAYGTRVMYRTFDVTGMLLQGENAAGAVLAEGWYCGRLGWKKDGEVFGNRPPRFLLQLEVTFEDGRAETFVTDGSWKCNTGPIVDSDLYDGETQDARLAMPGWAGPGFDDADWQDVAVFPDGGAARNAQMDPPIRVTEELPVRQVTEPQPGVFVLDLGQNMVGYCRLEAEGPAGTEITLRHAEEVNEDGAIYTENLRGANATDRFVLAGNGRETFTPVFTYHGFRYVEVTGYPGKPTADALTGLVVHTDCDWTAEFETSCEMVNRLYHNVRWGQRGNMHSVLTDCPQRDERLGWMGDAQIFARTACFNMDMAAMLTKFSRDMVDSQNDEGAFADVSPYVSAGGVLPPAGAPAWMDAGVIVPWTVYQCYGDTRILERHMDSMVRYLDYVDSHNPNGIWENARGNDYGDWVPPGEKADKTMFATLHWFYSSTLLSAAARVLGHKDVADRAAAMARRVRTAYNKRYLQDDGTYSNPHQSLDALALGLGICPPEARESVAAHLTDDVRSRGNHLATGFGGTQWLLPALSDTGYDELAETLLLQREYPSWGYMVDKGATTIWELWNSDTAGPGMNSRNHFAYGSVAEWLFRYLAGIDTTVQGAGYREIAIRPHPGDPGGELTHVCAAYDSIQGRIESEWWLHDDHLVLRVHIPANTTAQVRIPGAGPEAVTEGGKPLAAAPGVTEVAAENGAVVCRVGAGEYEFTAAR